MTRYLVAAVFAASIWLIFGTASFAQIDGQGAAAAQWCSPARAEDGGEVCSGSPIATCTMQNQS